MIFQAWPRQFAVDLDLARAELKGPVDQFQRVSRQRRRQERAVIIRTVADDLSRDDDLWKRLVCQLEMRDTFVVLEKDVESRLVLFDQVRLEDQRLDLVIDDNELKIRDHAYELPRLRILVSARLEILPHAVAQVFCLADIDDLAGGIFVKVNAREQSAAALAFRLMSHLNFTILERANKKRPPTTTKCRGRIQEETMSRLALNCRKQKTDKNSYDCDRW